MNDAGGAKTIDLAAAADFALGSVSVHPSTREVANGASREVLEPRVMQVLVALARRQGQVVSRDALVEMCWGGRAVGEDAIQRCIAKLRKLAETSGAFHIDTVARVGYRLRADGHAPATPALGTAGEPVLVVLPFDNLSDDREMQFFSDGVSEEILYAIARVRGVKVIGRMSAFEFRGPRKAEAARALNATHVLDGSVRRAGERIRINAQLVDARDKTSMWSEQYDRDIGDSLNLQSEIAAAIAAALRLQFEQGPRAGAIDAAAYELWLRARSTNLADLSDEHSVAAVTLLEQAIARAPAFARAWAALALNRAILLPRTHDAVGTPEHTAALAAANRALELDASCGDALQALAFLKPAFGGYREKLDLFERFLRLRPSDAFASFHYAGALVSVGRMRDSLPYYRLALELEPLSSGLIAPCAATLSSVGRVDEAMALIDSAWAKFPSAAIWFFRAWLKGMKGGSAAVLQEFSEDTALRVGVSEADIALFRHIHGTLVLPEAERRPAARALFDPKAPMLWIGLCKFAALAGCQDEVFEAFANAFASGQPIAGRGLGNFGIPRAVQSAGLFYFDGAAMRNDARFAGVCARLGLVDYWTTSGHWPDCAEEVPYDFKAECAKAAAEMGKA